MTDFSEKRVTNKIWVLLVLTSDLLKELYELIQNINNRSFSILIQNSQWIPICSHNFSNKVSIGHLLLQLYLYLSCTHFLINILYTKKLAPPEYVV